MGQQPNHFSQDAAKVADDERAIQKEVEAKEGRAFDAKEKD